MSEFRQLDLKEITANPFSLIGEQWMLITAIKDGSINTMTASWGGLGVLWNKNVAFVFIRPQRFTKEFIDANSVLTLSFYDEKHRSSLSYLGTKSGRDENKIENVDFHPIIDQDYAYFEEANLVLKCTKLYAQDLANDNFLVNDLSLNNYPNQDFHTMYIAEITEVLTKS